MFTARSVAALKARERLYDVPDGKVAGLTLRIWPDGRKLWTLRYRNRDTRQLRRLKLGAYPGLSLAKARRRAQAELRVVDGGGDPQAARAAVRQAAIDAKRAAEQAKANSIEALCSAYVERHAKRTKRSWRDDQSKLKREVLPRWKGRAVTSITRRDCRELVQAIADRGAPIFANRIVALLSRLFRFAVDEEIIGSNPAAHLPKPGVEVGSRPEGERERKAYDADEVGSIWQTTEALAVVPRAVYRLGLLTGQRPIETTGMEWAEVDGTWWTIPGRRTKNGRDHRVYLTQAALDILRDIPRDDERYVFAGWRGKRQLAELNRQVFAGVRPRKKPRHALRDTVTTGLAEAGVAVEDIAKVLNHAYGPRVTAGYNAYAYDRERRLALTKWARRLQGILNGQPKTGKVVPMRT